MSFILKSFVFLICALCMSGCSLFGGSKEPSGKEKDVAFQARKNLDEPRKKIIVLPFLDTSTERSQKMGEEARKALVRAIAKSDRFVIVHPSDLPKDAGSMVVNGEYDMDSVVKVCEPLGLAAVIEGKVLDVKAKKLGDEVGLFKRFKAKMDATVRLRMFSVRGNREIYNQTKSATIETSTTRFAESSGNNVLLAEDPNLISEVITKAFQGSVGQIVKAVEKLGWEGKVALIQGNRIFLNAGRLSGLQVGDILRVTAPGEDVFDPETGDLIGVAPGRMKGTLELVSYFGTDGAITVVHSGSGFQENDIVELY